MPKAVLDSTILVSIFLTPEAGGVAAELFHLADAGRFELFYSADIIRETSSVLLREERLRRRFRYSDVDVSGFCETLAAMGTLVEQIPVIRVVRDPDDDMILACAIAASADYLITRDKDLLILDKHEGIAILTPEAFLQVLRISD
jgi:putative PIN family toxin of toxin-antitoxin system